MIGTSLNFLISQLNAYLVVKTNGSMGSGGSFGDAVLNTLKTTTPGTPNMGVTLVNVEEERIGKAQGKTYVEKNGVKNVVNPEIRLNLYVLFTGNFVVYENSLNFISHVAGFFQSNMVFDHQSHPSLSSKIEKIVPELYSIPLEQLSYMWGALGANYMPSLLYKVRLVAIQEEFAQNPIHLIESIDITSQSV